MIDGFERGAGAGGDWEGAPQGLGGGGRGRVDLTAGTLHDIYLEYRLDSPQKYHELKRRRSQSNVRSCVHVVIVGADLI